MGYNNTIKGKELKVNEKEKLKNVKKMVDK
jgi:hypothetical protein